MDWTARSNTKALQCGGSPGFTSDDLIGRNAYEFVHPDDVAELKRQLSLALTGTSGLVPAEFRHRRGMPPEVLEHIFESFFSTKPPARGAGMGLASVFGIVAQSGGYITADSTPSEGSMVTMYLQELVVESPDDASADEVEAEAAVSATVLLVEDNDLLSTFAGNVLRSRGFVVLQARNASYAAPIDLLLTDVVMPGRSGLALAELLGRRRPDLRVLFMSGYTEDARLRHGLVAGDVAFLPKPFTAKALVQKVRESLQYPPMAGIRHSAR